MDAEHLKRILVVDDEADVTELLDYKFRQAGYAVRALNDPLRAIGLARDFRPDLIILDVMMPELTGVQLLRMVRADALLQDTPVIFLTAKAETADKVKGLESGADDYVAKPFDVRELMLRSQALLRRAKSAAAKPSTRLAAGALLLDIERHEVTAQGKPVELTATEFKLLRLLLERKGRVQSREERQAVLSLQLLRVDPPDIHLTVVRDARVRHRFVDRFVGILQLDVLADYADRHLVARVQQAADNLLPDVLRRRRMRQAQQVQHELVQPLALQRQRQLVNRMRHVAALDNCLHRHIAEQRKLIAQVVVQRMVRPAHQHVRLDADLAELRHRLLRGLGL